jgi:hypothetical protein
MVFSGVSLWPWAQEPPATNWRPSSGQRPLLTESRMLSECVPGQMWAGLTQPGLSQVWQAIMPSGNERPLANSHETRVAGRPTRPTEMRPYPFQFLLPIHGQQSLEPRLSTFDQKRCSRGVDFHGMGDLLPPTWGPCQAPIIPAAQKNMHPPFVEFTNGLSYDNGNKCRTSPRSRKT